jgi:hypothetical protein
VLLEEGSSRNLLLASTVALSYSAATSVGTRDVLATNLMSVDNTLDNIAYTKLDSGVTVSVAVVQCGQRKEQTVRLFATKTNCGYISLVGVHISTDVVAGVVLTANEIVLLCELNRQLSISREVYTNLTLGIVSGYTYSIAEHICQKQTVSIRVLTHIG